MSREIKFRVWNNNTNRYNNTELNYYFVIDQRINAYEYEQFTGLRDKNGRKIYEGDIVKWLDGLGEYVEFRVEWQDNRARFSLRNECSVYDYEGLSDKKEPYLEIIGNIHESNIEELCPKE